MKKHELTSSRGGGFLPALCNFCGTGIIILVILLCLPMFVPRLLGYELYNVVSASMEPVLPVGSIVVVESVAASSVSAKEIIAYRSGESVITHRVVENHTVEGEFITKGDANSDVDMSPVAYDMLIGRVIYHAPVLGGLMAALTSLVGKIYLIAFAMCGLMFNMLATRLRARRSEALLQAELERMKQDNEK